MNIIITPDALKNAFPAPAGNVQVEIDHWQDALLNDRPLGESSGDLARADLTTPGNGKPAEIGTFNKLKLSLGGHAELRTAVAVVSASDLGEHTLTKPFVTAKLLPANALAPGEIYLVWSASAAAALAAGAAGPVGIAQVGLGLNTEGDCELLRLVKLPGATGTRTALTKFFAELRWPLAIPSAANLDGFAEVVSLAYRGKLKLSASIGAGYEFGGAKGFELGQLSPRISYRVAAKAALDVGFTVGGAFRCSLAQGTMPGWIRLQVAREKQVGRTLGLGLDLEATHSLAGVPEQVDELIDGLLGLNIGTALDHLAAIAETKDFAGAAASLREKFGDFAERKVSELLAPLLKQTFALPNYHQFQATAARLIAARDRIDGSVELLVDRLGAEQKKIVAFIDQKLLGIQSAADLAALTDHAVWQTLVDLAGDTLIDAIQSTAAFQQLKAKIQQARDVIATPEVGELLQFWHDLEAKAGVTRLAGALAVAADPVAMQQCLAGAARQAAESIFDFVTTQLDTSPAGQALFARVKRDAQQLLVWRGKLEAALKKAREGKFRAALSAKFASSDEERLLLDLEFDPSAANGADLLRNALRGDLEGALAAAGTGPVRVLGGSLREVQTETRSLAIAALGWTGSAVGRVEQLVRTEIAQDDSGVVYLFSIETSYVQENKRNLEQTKVQFLLSATGEGSGPANDLVLRVVKGLAMKYSITHDDPATTSEEMREYLQFAADLGFFGLGTGLEDYLAQLASDFPAGLGKVRVSYSVQHDPEALLKLFYDAETDPLLALARQSVRRYFGQRAARNRKARETVAMYLDSVTIKKDHTSMNRSADGVNRAKAIVVTTAGKKFYPPELPILGWWEEEQAFLAALRSLDAALSPGNTAKELKEAALALCRVPKGRPVFGTPFWSENVFFLALDALVGEVYPPGRRALLTLDIQPPGAAAPVVRLLPLPRTAG